MLLWVDMPASRRAILWFRSDLRLSDHSALDAALKLGAEVIPVFIWAPDEEIPWAPGEASRWWLHHSLKSLGEDLRQRSSRLVLRAGPSLPVLRDLVRETGASTVLWSRRYEPVVVRRDQNVQRALEEDGVRVATFNNSLLNEPWSIENKSRRPFQVFTPFWRHCLSVTKPAELLSAPSRLPAPAKWPRSDSLSSWGLLPRLAWADGFSGVWKPGSAGALEHLDRFLGKALANYGEDRNRPDLVGTSRLSPHLHFGEISPRQVWHALRRQGESQSPPNGSWKSAQFLTEIGWREFAYHLLHHYPHTPEQPLRKEFERFPWRKGDLWLHAWQKGRTGYPLVDAGLRELWATGWMHNRVRMVVASFLVKHLQISWVEGARWFWDTLVDADLASNTLGWQWTSGCGADAAPYFRVFNPVIQGEKFDPKGEYVRKWVPELARLPDRYLHQPWSAPPEALSAARVRLGQDYPEPLVNHAIAREVALEAFSRLSRSTS
jgi:deoxyribodipyrimidine photo-lyase